MFACWMNGLMEACDKYDWPKIFPSDYTKHVFTLATKRTRGIFHDRYFDKELPTT
jgi:hypothetical protein